MTLTSTITLTRNQLLELVGGVATFEVFFGQVDGPALTLTLALALAKDHPTHTAQGGVGWGSQEGAAASLPQVPVFFPEGMSLCWAAAVMEKEREEDMPTTELDLPHELELSLDDDPLAAFMPPFMPADLKQQQAANRKAAGEIIGRLLADVERVAMDMQKSNSVAQRRSQLATAKKDVSDSHARVTAATHTLATARPTLTPPTLLLSGAQIRSRSVPLARQGQDKRQQAI